MEKQQCTGVDVPEPIFPTVSAVTPTTVQRPTAGNVGVLDVTLAARSAVTSTLPAAAAKGGGNAGGVVVAVSLLPATSAPTSTPTDDSFTTTTGVVDFDVLTCFTTTLVFGIWGVRGWTEGRFGELGG